jgi:hypothetical protein
LAASIFSTWIGFIFLAVSVFQCSSSNKVSNKKSAEYNPYFPATEGNFWEYINEAPREETELWKVEVRGQKSEGNDKIYAFSSFPFFSKTEEEKPIRMKEDGSVYMSTYADVINWTEWKILPEISNLKKDYTWNFGIWNGYVASTSETVKAENQTFTDCIKINYAASITFSAEIWLAKNTGIVKWGYFRTNPPTLTFTYYVLNKSSFTK